MTKLLLLAILVSCGTQQKPPMTPVSFPIPEENINTVCIFDDNVIKIIDSKATLMLPSLEQNKLTVESAGPNRYRVSSYNYRGEDGYVSLLVTSKETTAEFYGTKTAVSLKIKCSKS
jgi:hypothetical protein